MGLEASCKLRLDRYSFSGQAHVDSSRFTFRGDTRLDIPLAAVRAARIDRDGSLVVTHHDGEFTLRFEPASVAAKWADKFLHPPTLCDKLGLKPGQRVAVLELDDAEFLTAATARLGAAPAKKLTRELDIILYAADTPAALDRLAALKKNLQPAGAIWVVSRKGKAATLKDTDVMQAARAAGLVDNKTCSFSATHTALRLVIPRAAR